MSRRPNTHIPFDASDHGSTIPPPGWQRTRARRGLATRRLREESERSFNPSSQMRSSDSESTHRTPTIDEDELDDLHDVDREYGEDHTLVGLPLDEDVIESARDKVMPTKHNYHDLFQRHGAAAVIDAAFAESLAARHPFTTGTRGPYLANMNNWRLHGTKMLASCPRAMLEGVLDGTLPWKVEASVDPELVAYFDKSMPIAQRSPWAQRDDTTEAFAPSIYMRAYVDDLGKPPSRTELLRISRLMRQYISGDARYEQQNAEIDSQSRDQVDETDPAIGMHRYLGKQIRAERVETFCTGLELNLQTQPHNDAEENSLSLVKNPLKYFAFTTHPLNYAHQHASHFATNRIMALVVAIGKWAFRKPDGSPRFAMKGYTICHLTDTMECQLGEEIFCRIGGGYYYTGRGFNIASAGTARSGDLGDLEHRVATDKWNECLQFRLQLPFFIPQLQQEVQVNVPAYQRHVDQSANGAPLARREARQRRREENERRRVEIQAAIAEAERKSISIDALRERLQNMHDEHMQAEHSLRGDDILLPVISAGHLAIQKKVEQEIDEIAASNASSQSVPPSPQSSQIL